MSTSSVEPDRALRPRDALRRLSVELVLIVVAKIALLTLIWWLLFAPQPTPDTSPSAIAHRLAPSSQTPATAQP